MKIFIASIATETNTFCPAPTGAAAFSIERAADIKNAESDNPWRQLFDSMAANGEHEVVIGLLANAQPSGATVREVYESMRDELLGDLRTAMPVDAVILPLHGAMVADGYPDCEGDIIKRVREVVGDEIPIGVELDLHCHFTERMRRNADIIVAYKEYPHTDVIECFEQLWALTLDLAEGRIRPVTAVVNCQMVSFWHTTREPMLSFVRQMKELEAQEGVLSVSFGHGFPYGDVAEAGAKIWVVTDNDLALANDIADELRKVIWATRDESHATQLSLSRALDQLQSRSGSGKPTIIADVADNAGGGASSDSTFVLRGLVERGIGNFAIAPFWDLGAIAMCREAGLGATLDLRIGGKCGPLSGDPVDLTVTVRALEPDHKQTVLDAGSYSCGFSVWVSTDDGIDIVLISQRQQVYATNMFTDLGIDLEAKDAIVVKSTQHFHAQFAPLADKVLYVTTPGLLRTDFENMSYENRDNDFWPRVADPFRTGPN